MGDEYDAKIRRPHASSRSFAVKIVTTSANFVIRPIVRKWSHLGDYFHRRTRRIYSTVKPDASPPLNKRPGVYPGLL